MIRWCVATRVIGDDSSEGGTCAAIVRGFMHSVAED